MNRRVDTSEHALWSEMSRVCVGFNLRRAARAVSQIYDSAMQDCGLRATQFSMLVAISTYGPLTINDLANGGVMDQTTVSRNVRVLQKQGYVEMVPGTDKRTRAVSITNKGKSVLRSALPHWNRVQASMAKKLGDKEVKVLLEGLRMAVKVAKQL